MSNLKDIAAILYTYYLDKICEDDFNFDNGEFSTKIREHYKKIDKDFIKQVQENINVSNIEGTNYDWLKIIYTEEPSLFIQVTAIYDYDGKFVDGYTGDNKWVDVGLIFLDYNNVNFDDL